MEPVRKISEFFPSRSAKREAHVQVHVGVLGVRYMLECWECDQLLHDPLSEVITTLPAPD